MSFEFSLSPEDEAVADLVSSVGRALQQRFTSRQMTPETFAAALGLSGEDAMRLLSGARDLRLSELAKIALALGVSVSVNIKDLKQ
jgi:transcriptional regulator with XRE-family HTH domain